MKSTLQYALTSLLATLLAVFTATAVAESSVRPRANAAARVAQENLQAEEALNSMAHETLIRYGEKAFPAAMAVQLSSLAALCRGVDVARVNRRPEKAAPVVRMQTTNMQMLQVSHPLCKRLTATAI